MDFVDGPVPLGEWLPDLQDLKFPNLTNAKNVEPFGTVYKSFEPLLTSGGGVVPGGFIRGAANAVYNGITYTYVGTDDGIFMSLGGSFTARSATMGPTQYDFLQFDNLEIVTGGGLVPLYHTVGSATNFATLGSSSGTAPAANRIGKINQFVIVASNAIPHRIQWSGIDKPLSWPTPNTATATAQQAGEQYLDAEFGDVTGFANGDQFGIVFQQSAITRVSYAGPPVVFSFDKISTKVGCPYPRSIVQVGGHTYFIAASGIQRTDGVNVENIGLNKVNDFFLTAHGSRSAFRVYGAHNAFRNLIYWTFCDTSDADSTPSGMIIYNCLENRFTWAGQTLGYILGTTGLESSFVRNITGFGASNTAGAMVSGTVGALPASFETGDVELNPGGMAFLSGAKLIVDATANAIVGYSKIRNELLANQVTTSAASTATPASGFCDFRREARYHRVLWEVTGVFEQAQGMEFRAQPTGSR